MTRFTLTIWAGALAAALAACGSSDDTAAGAKGGAGGSSGSATGGTTSSGGGTTSSGGGTTSSGGASGSAGAAGSGGSTPTPIDPSDIVFAMYPNQPFAGQSNWGGQVIGTFPNPATIGESGVSYQGELRLGKSDDPDDSTKKCMLYRLDQGDPSTAGSHRSEICQGSANKLDNHSTYWITERVRVVSSWTPTGSQGEAIVGFQVHNADTFGLSPALSMHGYLKSGAPWLRLDRRDWAGISSPTQSNGTVVDSDLVSMPIDAWTDVVASFRMATDGSGFLKVWIDGVLANDSSGINLGLDDSLVSANPAYGKAGFYNWNGSGNTQTILTGAVAYVLDPTGSKYTNADMTAWNAAN